MSEKMRKLKNYKPTRFMLPTSHYDKDEADFAVDFIQSLCHTKGKWAGVPFELIDWQERIIRDIFGTRKADGYRQFKTAYVEIPKKMGKEVSLSTPIPTPTGYTTMGEIKVGDIVFSETGKPCHVVAKSAVDYDEQAYRITFKDGEVVEAGENHQWFGEYTHGKRKQMIMTTGELYKFQQLSNEDVIRFRIAVAHALETSDADLPIEPYLMGYWLGNGCATEARITIQTADINGVLAQIEPHHAVARIWQNVGDSVHVYIPDLKKILPKSFHDKKIPIEYLRASERQRWRLLQGLMDSDGSVSNRKGQAIYTSTEKLLAQSVSELLWSLGIKNAITTAVSTQRADWSKPSKECGRVATGETLYYVKFTAYADKPVASLERKQRNAVKRKNNNANQRSNFRYIDNIEPIKNTGMQCIQVDSPSHQYLIGRTCLPTHNSELAAAIALLLTCADGEQRAEVYGCAADRQQASIVFDVAADMVRMCPGLAKYVKIQKTYKRMTYLPTNSFYQVLSAEVACFMPDTVIQTADGRICRADEVKVGDVILSHDGLSPVFDEVVSIEEEPPAEVLEISTFHNRKIQVTEEHPFYAMLPGRRRQDLTHEYDWLTAKEIKKDTRLGVSLGWPTNYEPTSEISELEAWALGAWAGDGDCTHFRFINMDAEVVDKLSAFFQSIGSSLKSEYSTRQKQAGKDKTQPPIEHQIIGAGKRKKSPGREWVRLHFGQNSKAKTKKIPDAVWRGSPKIWAAFLAGYLDTDGHVCKEDDGHETASICSVSTDMTKGCQILLARLGINASTAARFKVGISGKPQLRELCKLLTPYMVHVKKKARLFAVADKPIQAYQRANESDKIKSIRPVGIQKTISFEMKRYQTHSTDGLITHNTKHGLNVSGVVFDELHTQPNRKLFDVMTQGSGDARSQPLYFLITTAGSDTNSICYEQHQKAVDIMEGRKHDSTFYPVIFGADMEDDWTDPKIWKKANPSLGITVDIENVREACESAKQNPGEENAFRQLRLNQWVKQAVRWMPMQKWDACKREIDREELKGRTCYGGLDLSQTTDITAFVLVFPPRDETEEYIVLPFFWMPEDNIPLRVNRDHVPYDTWQRQGLMNITEGNVIHYGYIEKFIEKLGEEYHIAEIAFDRWGAVQMAQDLEDMGFTVVPFGQGFKDMSPPTKELMKLVLEQKIVHDGNVILRWMVDNIFIKTDPAGNIKMDKEKSTEKIDGAVAMVMALDRAIRCGATPQESIYDTRGMIFF